MLLCKNLADVVCQSTRRPHCIEQWWVSHWAITWRVSHWPITWWVSHWALTWQVCTSHNNMTSVTLGNSMMGVTSGNLTWRVSHHTNDGRPHLLCKLYTFRKACPIFMKPHPLKPRIYCGCIPSRQNNLLGGANHSDECGTRIGPELSFTSHGLLFPLTPALIWGFYTLHTTSNLGMWVDRWELKPLFQSRESRWVWRFLAEKYFVINSLFWKKKKGSPKT
jgi:hypothetical protein